MNSISKVAPWEQQRNGRWSRPLIGPERMFDQWLEIDGWAEWMSAVIFTVDSSLASEINSKASVESWFNKAVSLICLEKPSLLATIERGQEGSATAKSRDFIYDQLMSDDDLAERVKQKTTILHTEKSAKDGLKSLTDEFYSAPEKRISIEQGQHPIHISFVSSSVETGTFALAIRCNHALNDFWSGAAILNSILGKLADGLVNKTSSPSYKDASASSLHPCYLDILQNPIGDTPLDDVSQGKAQQLLGANLENITICPITQEPAKDLPGTDYAIRRRVFSQDMTKKILQICKAHKVTVTALLTALQALALLKTFPPPDSSRTTAAPICVSNRLKHTSLGINGDSGVGPVMATTFLVSPFDVSPFLKITKDDIYSQDWQKDVWKVAVNASRATGEAVKSAISEHVDWTQGPTAFGGVAHAMEAMKAGHLPSPPGMYTPLSSAGLLDGTHLQESYGNQGQNANPALKLDDFSFYSRVSNLFGPQTWAWTALGKLNLILVMPDPRVRSVPNLEWWDMLNDVVVKMATDSLSNVDAE